MSQKKKRIHYESLEMEDEKEKVPTTVRLATLSYSHIATIDPIIQAIVSFIWKEIEMNTAIRFILMGIKNIHVYQRQIASTLTRLFLLGTLTSPFLETNLQLSWTCTPAQTIFANVPKESLGWRNLEGYVVSFCTRSFFAWWIATGSSLLSHCNLFFVN